MGSAFLVGGIHQRVADVDVVHDLLLLLVDCGN